MMDSYIIHFQILSLQVANNMVRLCGCTGLSEALLLAYMVHHDISCSGSFITRFFLKGMILHENCLPADDSREIACPNLLFKEKKTTKKKNNKKNKQQNLKL